MADEEETTTSLMCWLNDARVCGPSCMAYVADLEHAVLPVEMRQQAWSRCHLLGNVHRTGKHLVVLASVAKSRQEGRIRAGGL